MEYFANNIDAIPDLPTDFDPDDSDYEVSDVEEADLIDTHEEVDPEEHLADNDQIDYDSDSSDDNVPLANFVQQWRNDFPFTKKTFLNTVYPDEPIPEDTTVKKPLDYFTQYIDVDTFDIMAKFTNMRGVETKGHSFKLEANDMALFIGVSMLISIYNLPRIRMNWARRTRIPIVADNISRNKYFLIRANLKVVDDNSVTQNARRLDKFWKVRPLLAQVLDGCRKNVRPPIVSIDEQMIPFHGSVAMKQFVRGKPHPVGLKNFVMCTPGGLPLDFFIYEGKDTEGISCLFPLPTNLDIGGKVITKLADTLPTNTTIYMDRYFTSIPVIDHLLQRSIYSTGTLMKSRIPKTSKFKSDNELRKQRGSHDQQVRRDKHIAVVKWFDSRPIFIASSQTDAYPEGTCKRWSKSQKKYIEIKRPALVEQYNKNMGGVDLLDRVIAKYTMRAKTRKWTVRTIFHFFDFAAAASWLKYREQARNLGLERKQIMDYLDFKTKLAESLIYHSKSVSSDETTDGSDHDEPPAKLRKILPVPPKDMRKVDSKHMPEDMTHLQKTRSKCRLQGCNQLTFVKCSTCKVYFCFNANRNCFKIAHF